MIPERARDERGFTLVEVLAVMPLALIVAAAALTLLLIGERSNKVTTERSVTLREQQVGLERMTRELRQAAFLVFLTSSSVEFDTFVRVGGGPAELRRVRYDCSVASRCVRQLGTAGVTVPATAEKSVLIDRVENADVFQPEPSFLNPSYLGVVVRVRFATDRPLITLRDGINLRNVSVRG